MWLFAVGITMAIIGSVVGNFLVKKGSSKIDGQDLKSFGGIQKILNPIELYKFLKQLNVFNWQLWVGIAFLTLFFGGYVLAMQQAPVTLVVPLMASTYIINTFLGKFFLNEKVNWLRWAGVMVIVAGIILLVGFSEAEKQSTVEKHSSTTIGVYQFTNFE